jgi:hypothetical protein
MYCFFIQLQFVSGLLAIVRPKSVYLYLLLLSVHAAFATPIPRVRRNDRLPTLVNATGRHAIRVGATIRCMQAHLPEDVIEDYAMRRVTGDELRMAEEHLLLCPTCRQRVESVEALQRGLWQLANEE